MRKKNDRLQRAYLLRCWLEDEPAASAERRWRFSLEEILHKQPRQGFDSLDTMLAFLRDELDGDGEKPSA